jgi:LPPG:FO 2-phospho-L-lactate transferase
VSIDPILNLPGILDVLTEKIVLSVSPIIQGKTIKGPAAKMFVELGIPPTSRSVLDHYAAFLDGFVYDALDDEVFQNYDGERIILLGTDTLMKNDEDKTRLAAEILRFGKDLISRKAP